MPRRDSGAPLRCPPDSGHPRKVRSAFRNSRQSDRRRVRVENAHDVEFLTAGEDPERRDCQQKTAVEHQSALIDPDDPPEVIPVLVEKLDDVKDSRPDDSGNHRDEERGGRLIGGHSRIFAGPADQPGGEQKTDRRHQPVTAE